jgi:hypothetical protein
MTTEECQDEACQGCPPLGTQSSYVFTLSVAEGSDDGVEFSDSKVKFAGLRQCEECCRNTYLKFLE